LQVILAPGHEAIGVLRDLLAVLDSNPIAIQYLRTAGGETLPALERKARAVAARADSLGHSDPAAGLVNCVYCPECRAHHRFDA
jgi:hypothetical protein